MGKQAAWQDEYTLLCERCGYVVEGLPTEGACPECGKPIAESLPERRVGTAWQREPSPSKLMVTWIATLATPRKTLDDLTTAEARDAALANACAWCAAIPPCLAAVIAFLAGAPAVRDLPNPVLLAACGFGLIGLWVCVRVLIAIERRGLMLIGSTRGFRTTPALAQAITSHGAVGWVVAGLGLTLMILGPLGAMLVYRFNGDEDATVGRLGITGAGLGLLLVVFGFLFFETFAWLGLRRLKYANRARPTPHEPDSATHAAD